MAERPMLEKRNLSAFMQQLRLAARRSAFSCSSRSRSSSDIIVSSAMFTAVALGARRGYSGGSDASDGLRCRAIVAGLSGGVPSPGKSCCCVYSSTAVLVQLLLPLSKVVNCTGNCRFAIVLQNMVLHFLYCMVFVILNGHC